MSQIFPKKSRIERRPGRGLVVAVSGAGSFLGNNLIQLLQQDQRYDRIIGLEMDSPIPAGPRTRHYSIDLTHPGVQARLVEILRAEQVSAFVHTAFLSRPSNARAWSHEYESVGTMHVLNACREVGLSKFVLASQTSLYGPTRRNPNFISEDNPLRGLRRAYFLRDKIEAERETARFAKDMRDACVTVLRLAPLMGPTVDTWVTRWLSRRLVPTMLGYDPLVQFLHEMDAVAAFKMALDQQVPGVFNIVGEGVMPISQAILLAERIPLPLPQFVLRSAMALLWATNMNEAPPEFASFLRYLCVGDGARAEQELGFRPAYSSREAVADFAAALQMRERKLIQEAV